MFQISCFTNDLKIKKPQTGAFGPLLLADCVIDLLPEIISEAFVISFPERCADMMLVQIDEGLWNMVNLVVR